MKKIGLGIMGIGGFFLLVSMFLFYGTIESLGKISAKQKRMTERVIRVEEDTVFLCTFLALIQQERKRTEDRSCGVAFVMVKD